MKHNKLALTLIASFLVISVLYGLAPLLPPNPAPSSIPPDQFSAERAMQHVRTLSQAPRQAGSPGLIQAEEYLEKILQSCNLVPEFQEFQAKGDTLRNVIVRIPGSNPGKEILVVSHVDSVSFGAGDNATGAAVLAELACNLQAGKQLRNDVILLFEDGEEAGYLGGYAYASSGTSLFALSAVVGLDTAAWGPVVLLQTTPGNAGLIQAYASSVQNPTAFGFFADADTNISHDNSEIQPFYEQGIPGIDLEDPTAFSGKHTAADTIAHIKPGSLQQMGDQVLALTRSLGNSGLPIPSKTDNSFFTLWGMGVLHYPARWNTVFMIVLILGLMALIIKQTRQKAVTLRRIVLSIVLLLLAFVGAAVFGAGCGVLFEKLFPNPSPINGSYLVPASLPYFLAVIILALVGFLFIRTKLAGRVGESSLSTAGMLCWSLLAIAASLLLPVGSYIFTIPLLLGVGFHFLPFQLRYARLIPVITAAVLFAPNIVLGYLGAGQQILVLAALLITLNAELWAEAYAALSARSLRSQVE